MEGKKYENALEGLRDHSVIVADTAQYKIIPKYNAQDVTTNPFLILQAAEMKDYEEHIKAAVKYGKTQWHNFAWAHTGYADPQDESKFNYNDLSDEEKRLFRLFVFEKLTVSFGIEITKIIPGWVSTQLDPRMAYDYEGMLASARRMAKHYEIAGVKRDRFMIKVPSTWEGIQAAKTLEAFGIHVNMTLMFSFAQAIASSDAGVTMISPYVARITDWFVLNNKKEYTLEENPGLLKVAEVWRYFKHFNLKTAILVANCRLADEVLQLSGCDRHTIGPSVLDDLQGRKDVEVPRKCKLEDVEKYTYKKISIPDEKTFRWMLNEDAAAYEKLADGLRKFGIECNKMDKLIEKYL
jgi:transaldolase